jgi:dTDP-4-dehydrorhamnose 3,5-epimerase-like enzyme
MKSIRKINLNYQKGEDGDLVAAQGCSDSVPFSIARVFNVRANKGITRGRHAHRECTQILICSNGKVKVTCDNGSETSVYILDKPNQGLLIEPGVWSEQMYIDEHTLLTVLCDFPYDETDYIRNYDDFLKYKANNNSQ